VQFREVTEEEVARNPHQYAKNVEQRSDWIRLRGQCVAGFVDGRVVYHMWFRRAEGHQLAGLPGSWRPMGRVLFLYDGFTVPEVRGRGIHTGAVAWLVEQHGRNGIAHVLGYVNAANVAGRRALERIGFTCVGEMQGYDFA
jgi:GNAT superfamily N-acetyltransferase